MATKKKCEALAARLGCTLEVDRRRRHVTIWLPEGKQVEESAGLDCLCNDAETMDEVWPLVHADLQGLSMEPTGNAEH